MSMCLFAEPAHAQTVDGGMVGGDVHILAFGGKFDCESMLAGTEVSKDGRRQSPVVPVASASVRHYGDAEPAAVDRYAADGAFVFGVDRTVAVGVDEVERVFTVGRYSEGNGDGACRVVGFEISAAVIGVDGRFWSIGDFF